MPGYLKIILSVGLVAVLLAIFLITFIINKHTKVPDNCPKLELGSCGGCMLTCGKREEEVSISKITSSITSGFKKDETKDKQHSDVKKGLTDPAKEEKKK